MYLSCLKRYLTENIKKTKKNNHISSSVIRSLALKALRQHCLTKANTSHSCLETQIDATWPASYHSLVRHSLGEHPVQPPRLP